MGCSSGKVSSPKSASETARAENTLLGPSGLNEAVKEVADVPADSACFSKIVFDGVWTKGVIAGGSLTWADGTISAIRVDEVNRVLEVNVKGTLCTGSLAGEGDKICWSDGDIWDRCEVDAREIPKLSDDAWLLSNETPQPARVEMALGNSQAFAEIQLADDPVAHTSQAHECGELVQFAGARLPSIPEAEKLSPEKTREQVNAVANQVEAVPKAPPASTESRASSVQLEVTPTASLAHTSHSQPSARVSGPGSANNETMFADSREDSRVQSEPRKEKNLCCC